MTRKTKQRGFTLIELLVVVLIIGILAAVAVPQYQKAVEKSKAAQGLTLLKTLEQAYKAHFMATGTYADKFEQLDVDFPSLTGNDPFVNHGETDSKSNDEWILEIEKTSEYVSLFATRRNGIYKGAGFIVQMDHPSRTPPQEIECFERVSAANLLFDTNLASGAYCEKVMHATFNYESEYSRIFTW